ncbi:Phage shock protein PspC (stress-responsive transcriptional regulator) [Micromonospora phaseoli]|uniref:Phage shock protein PspC (Stress-responsive transcriptional regulator) n=1 Tax=Micromonospora phaseoli TaxID=1144548 RepID=A0A1H6X1Z4_9ACTN|nr:PspC domain-containing protein [Micromonospora phaseoli]PZW01992.1 phage shock protein C (PspC) family protein [Micromonospora phaseoli]GIJ80169.1 PspC family transcriptional regulator [Micromonospora phaseoli]SEJ21564.1 Phage shock protein PspC (stress-responsive transcriptional regulator) [Micromonospora phaseoli]
MTDDAARPQRPEPTEADPTRPPSAPPADTPPAGGTAWDAYATPPPPGPEGPGGTPFGGTGFTSRYGLVRPREGRYLAGVCAAVGRATNTDPVLWRVLLAVLGFFGGVGILVYVAAWLIIPGEGDSASPVESMLGRGRSSMSPVTVIVLSVLVAVGFGFIVTDPFRAVLLGAAILVGGALLLNRQQREQRPGAAPPSPAMPGVPRTDAPAPPPGPVPPVGYLGAPAYPPPYPGFGRTATAVPAAFHTPGPASGVPPAPPVSPGPGETTLNLAAAPAPAWPPAAPPGLPATAPTYRPPFAPHGPYAGQGTVAPPPPTKVKRPKKPRERSALGAVTFSLIFVALGVVGVLDLLDVFWIGASAYFAAALAVIALGLLVGTWFGRARWLIALGLVTAAALAVATVAESYDRVRGVDGAVTWAPTDHGSLAVRYEQSFADAVLDLRAIDFNERDTEITVVINFGEATVVLPPNVDVTAVAQVTAGDANIFGQRARGLENRLAETVDLGADGSGGGKLRLNLHVNAGHMEVTR